MKALLLADRFPSTPIYSDVTTLNYEYEKEKIGIDCETNP